MVKCICFFISLFIFSCKSTSCIIDDRLIVKESVDMDLSFLKEKIISKNDFDLIVSGRKLRDINMEYLKGENISFDDLQSIALISTFEKNKEETWDEYKSYALNNSKLYYLGKHVLDELDLYFILVESPSFYTDKENQALYMITEGVNEKWCTALALSLYGIDSQMITTTKRKADTFTYIDYSYSDKSCAKYKLDNTGAIKKL